MSFLILPMQGAVISNDVEISKDLVIISGKYEEKRKKLSKIFKINNEEMDYIMDHTQKSRSNDFFNNPILIYKTTIENILEYPQHVIMANYITHIINVVYWAYIYPKNKINIVDYMFTKRGRISEYRPDTRADNKHILVVSDVDDDFKLFPFRSDYNFDFELDWVNDDNKYKKKVLQLLKMTSKDDSLSRKIKRACSFFNKAIYFNTMKSTPFFGADINSDMILFLHTALECMILRNSEEKDKSLKLRKYLSKTISIEAPEGYKDIFQFIKYITNSRGKYVHEGQKYSEKNLVTLEDLFNDNKHLTDLEVLAKIVATILCKHIGIISKIHNDTEIKAIEYEKEFYKKIDKVMSKI